MPFLSSVQNGLELVMADVHAPMDRPHIPSPVSSRPAGTGDKKSRQALFQGHGIHPGKSGGDERVPDMQINEIVCDLRDALGPAEALVQRVPGARLCLVGMASVGVLLVNSQVEAATGLKAGPFR